LLVTKAGSGDRAAYFKLNQLQFHLQIEVKPLLEILNGISSKVEAETIYKEVTTQPIWDVYGINPQKATLDEFKEFYIKTGSPVGRFNVIRQVFNDNRFSEQERFDFVATALQQDNDLGVLQEACNLMDVKRKSNEGLNHWGNYLSWYKENRENYKTNTINQPQ
jgi:hypothetical protein